jgi:hypothetical protein
MRKYVIGFIIGVFLTLPTAIFADEVSNVGKRIAAEVPVILNGKELPVKAVAFDGTSYAPVRVIAEALGLEVDFQDRKVILTSRIKRDGEIDEMVETTYKGLKAVNIDGKTFFSLKDYVGKFSPFGWRYDKTTNNVYLVEYESESSSDVKRVLLEVDLNVPDTYVDYKGQTYVSIEYYREPSEFDLQQDE